MPERISLSEHAECQVSLAPGQVRSLLDLARGRLTLRPTGEPNRYNLQSGSHVGTLALPRLQLLIRPKVPLANLFYMLGLPGIEEQWQDEAFDYATERQLLPAFAAFFARASDRALGRGPLHAYRSDRARLSALRGRVDFAVQARRPGPMLPVACRYQDFTADVLENRALRAAIRRCLQLGGVPDRVRGTLLHQLARLDDVADSAVDPEAVDRIAITRLNGHYKLALRLAALVLRATTLTSAAGAAQASAFLIDMNQLFEAYVAQQLRKLLRPWLTLRDQYPGHLDLGRQVGIRPDLVFEREERRVLVADTKYKLSADGLGRADDYYQLLAYTTVLGLPAGLLVYCHSGSGVAPREVRVRQGGQRLWSQAVRVTGSRADLERSMAELASLVLALSQAPHQSPPSERKTPP